MCEIFSVLTIKTPDWRKWCHYAVFILNFEHILHFSSVHSFLWKGKCLLDRQRCLQKTDWFHRFIGDYKYLSSYFLVQSLQLKHQNVWNMFKVNNKDTRATSMTSFWCLYCQLWTNSRYFWCFHCWLDKQMPAGIPVKLVNLRNGNWPERFARFVDFLWL